MILVNLNIYIYLNLTEIIKALQKGKEYQGEINNLFNDSLLFFCGFNSDRVLLNFKLFNIEISGGNNKERHKLSINAFKLSIACFALGIDKFNIGYNFHNITYYSKIDKGEYKDQRLNNLLKRRSFKFKSMEDKK